MTSGMAIPKFMHAVIPDHLYKSLVELARDKAKDGDMEAARWLLDERIALRRKVVENDFASMKHNKGFTARYYGKPCIVCGKPSDTIDHIVPISCGGTNDIENLQPMCRSCNSKKNKS